MILTIPWLPSAEAPSESSLHECSARLALGQSLPIELQASLVETLEDILHAANEATAIDDDTSTADVIPAFITALDRAAVEANEERDKDVNAAVKEAEEAKQDLEVEKTRNEDLRAQMMVAMDDLKERTESAEERATKAEQELAEMTRLGTNLGIVGSDAKHMAVLSAELRRLENRLTFAGDERRRAYELSRLKLDDTEAKIAELTQHVERLEQRIIDSAGVRRRSRR